MSVHSKIHVGFMLLIYVAVEFTVFIGFQRGIDISTIRKNFI